MAEYKWSWSVLEMCRVLQVSSSAYYAWTQRPRSQHTRHDEDLKTQISDLFTQVRGRYGSPRIYRELQSQGVACSLKRVARLMQELGLAASKPRRFVKTTDSKHEFPLSPNRLDRNYQVESIAGLNRAWAGDITYIPTAQGWLYLAVVLDLKSRRVIGWSMADTMEQSLVQDALSMAAGQRLFQKPGSEQKSSFEQKSALEKGNSPDTDLLFHSDRGSQYAGGAFQRQLRGVGIQSSMSRKGNCWDNAPLESFFATLKKELVYREEYLTHQQAKASLFEYIELFYNRLRRHSTLGYISPAEFELNLLN